MSKSPRCVAQSPARGYGPELTDSGTIITRNYPLHRAAKEQPERVCWLNHALLQGHLEERGYNPKQAELTLARDNAAWLFTAH